MIYVVDTHAIVWYLADDHRLSLPASEVLDDPSKPLVIPTIVLAELNHLHRANRVPITMDEVLALVDSDGRYSIHPLDREVARMVPGGLNIHDAIICVTALTLAKSASHEIAVITRDKQIRDSGLVETIW